MLSHANPHFDTADLDEAIGFVRQTTLGTLVVQDPDAGFRSLQSPWTPGSFEGSVLSLISHIPRRSSLAGLLAGGCSGFVIFLGEQGYISPSWFAADGRGSAPTWNYETFECAGRVTTLGDPALVDHLEALCEGAEQSVAGDWSLTNMGARFDILRREIIGIRLSLDHWEYRRKLGQDERAGDFDQAAEALERQGRHRLARRMRDARPDA